MKLFLVFSSPSSFLLLPSVLCPDTHLSTLLSNILDLFIPNSTRPSFIPIQNDGLNYEGLYLPRHNHT
jgi:hypothetical protein